MASHDHEIQVLGKKLTMAREHAILGDYDAALLEFKSIFSQVHSYSLKYNGNPSGYDKQSRAGTNSSADYYLQEKWNQFKKDLKQEYDMIV